MPGATLSGVESVYYFFGARVFLKIIEIKSHTQLFNKVSCKSHICLTNYVGSVDMCHLAAVHNQLHSTIKKTWCRLFGGVVLQLKEEEQCKSTLNLSG